MSTVNLNIDRQNIVPETIEASTVVAGMLLIGSAVKNLETLKQLTTLKGLAESKFTLIKGTVGVALISGSLSSAIARNTPQKLLIEPAPRDETKVNKKQEVPVKQLSEEEKAQLRKEEEARLKREEELRIQQAEKEIKLQEEMRNKKMQNNLLAWQGNDHRAYRQDADPIIDLSQLK